MSWLTKFLGYDFTIGRLESQVQDYRDLVRTKDEIFANMISLKDEEIQRLTNLFLTEHGVIHPESTISTEPKRAPRPINRRPSWAQVKRGFEEKDALYAREQSTQLAKYWKDKDAEAAKESQ